MSPPYLEMYHLQQTIWRLN